MILKRFSVLIIFRIALIIGNVLLLSWILGNMALFFNQIILLLILAGQIGELIHFVNHTNRELTRLFLAIKHADFAISFKEPPLGKSFRELQQSFTEIIQAYKQVKIEKEGQYQFLQVLVKQIHIGIISIEAENVVLINPVAEHLFGIKGLKNWNLLKHINPYLQVELENMGENGRKLLELKQSGEKKMLAVEVNTLTILNKPLKLITVQEINAAIEQKEIEAWHRLIRILTHEIMNSITPISSLTETLQSMLSDRAGKPKSTDQLTEDTVTDIRFSLHTIQKRSEGLLHFVENYRKLSKIPKPVIHLVDISAFFARIENLMKQAMQQHHIDLSIAIAPETETIHGDSNLIEQVIINLLTNSIHALQDTEIKRIRLLAYPSEHHTVLEVADNGVGIPEKELQDIFVPFFSTKKEGSGIGLSLSKQIMSLHGGSIKVSSNPTTGTSFYLYFKK